MASFKNNGKLKLLIVVGTRPEIIRLAAVINKCRTYFDTLLAHTGQNYDYNLNGIFFRDLGLADPDVYLEAVGNDLGETMIAYHAETGIDEHLRCDGIRRVHFRKDGTPYFQMSAEEDLCGQKVFLKIQVPGGPERP